MCLGGVSALTLVLACSGDGDQGARVPATTVPADATGQGSEPGDVGTVELTVAGPVTSVVDAHLFVIGAEGADPVVVLTPRRSSGLRTGSVVEVTGALRRLTIAAVEAEFGIDVDDRRAGGYEGHPALIATEVRTPG